MNKVFEEESRRIRLYFGVTIELDPFEKNTETTYTNPLAIDAIVTDLTFTQIEWKMKGIQADKAKSLIIRNKHKKLIKQSYKIDIDGEDYEGWKVNGRMQFRDLDKNFSQIYIYNKK